MPLPSSEASAQFQAIADRNLNQLLFSVADFSASFRSSIGNTRGFAALGVTQASIDVALSAGALEGLNDATIKRYADQFNAMNVPVTFLLPSQLISVSLATSLAANRDVLMRLGTGQGKSIVLALSAVAALKVDSGIAPSRVFVLTTYDHLAVRDHAFASKVITAEGFRSICITHNPASIAGFQLARVVYANAMAVDKLLSDLMMEVNEGKVLGPDQAAFVNAFYNIDKASYVVLLDEFDLILDDLQRLKPLVRKIPTAVLSRADSAHPSQDIIPEIRNDEHDVLRWFEASAAEDVIDADTGVMRKKVYPMMFVEGAEADGWFNLSPSIFRLSQFLERAVRVMGLSGSTNDNARYVLGNRNGGAAVPYFALPFSHDPELFETRIVPSDFAAETEIKGGSAADLTEGSGIWCHTRLVVKRDLDHVVPIDPSNGLPYTGDAILASFALATLAEVDEWAQQIVSDIISVTS